MKFKTLFRIYCKSGFNGYMWQLALEDIRTRMIEEQIGENT